MQCFHKCGQGQKRHVPFIRNEGNALVPDTERVHFVETACVWRRSGFGEIILSNSAHRSTINHGGHLPANAKQRHNALSMVTVSSVSDSECDLTITTTCSHNTIASLTRATTTLKNDAGVEGSVMVHSRATRATENALYKEKTQPQCQ